VVLSLILSEITNLHIERITLILLVNETDICTVTTKRNKYETNKFYRKNLALRIDFICSFHQMNDRPESYFKDRKTKFKMYPNKLHNFMLHELLQLEKICIKYLIISILYSFWSIRKSRSEE